MKERELRLQSTARLADLFRKADQADIDLLREYNFGGAAPGKTCEDLVAQIRYNGSHDLAHLFSGDAEYLDIVRNVADKMSVKWEHDEDEEIIERKLYGEIFSRAWRKMSPAEREPIRRLFEGQGIEADYISRLLVEGTITDLLPTIGYLVGWNIARIVAVAAAREAGAELVGGLVAEGFGVLLGPVGILVGMVVMAVDLAGPAYRKIIPTVLQIAFIRQKVRAVARS